MSQPAAMLLTLALAPAALGSPPAPALELAGRGYKRVPTGPLHNRTVDPALLNNAVPIQWPQAPVTWGLAPYVLLLRASDGAVLANMASPAGYVVLAGDQPRIAADALTILAVGPNTDRLFGLSPYGLSLYGRYPPEGAVFAAAVELGFAWWREDNACAAWTPPAPILAGGCQ